MGLGTSQTSRNDLAVFLDKVAQRIEILVVDLINTGSRETAELATFKQRILLSEFFSFLYEQ